MRALGDTVLTALLGWAGLAVLALLVWLLPQIPDPFWVVPLVLAAIPTAGFIGEWRLVKRRALLGAVTAEGGRLRTLLWSGSLLRIGAAGAAVAMTTALYLSASVLQWQHWLVLAGYVAVLALATGPVRSILGGEVSGAHLGLIARHGPLLKGGILILGVAFTGLDLVLDQPDLRVVPFWPAVEAAYRDGFGSARAASLGALLGMANAARTALWHWAQATGPALDAAALVFWLAFVTVIGGIASLVTVHVLAAIALAERFERRDLGALAHPFGIGMAAALAGMAAFHAIASQELSRQAPDARALPHIRMAAADPCRGDRTRQKLEAITAEAAAFSRREQSRSDAEIEAAAARAFASLEPGVDRYLDWYFSIPGEYGRLWQAMAGDGAAFIGGKFKDVVIGEGALEARLAVELGRIEARSSGRMRAMAQAHAESLRTVLGARRCLADALPAMEQRPLGNGPRHVAGAAAGSLAGVAAGAAIATRLGARVAAGRGAIGAGRLAARALGRTAGKRGASAGGAAAAAALVCSPSGPGALVCGAAAGIGTWLGVDALVLRGDEWLNRDEMRAEILEGLDDSRDALVAALETANAARIAIAVDEIEASREAVFAPIREGLGREG